MKITFEIINTTSKPINIFIENNVSLNQLHDVIIEEIELHSILTKEAILDIFVENNISEKTLSIPISDTTIQEFIDNNPLYFSLTSGVVYDNVYKIYVMDKIYIHRLRSDKPAPIYNENPRKIKTNHLQSFFENTKKMIYLF